MTNLLIQLIQNYKTATATIKTISLKFNRMKMYIASFQIIIQLFKVPAFKNDLFIENIMQLIQAFAVQPSSDNNHQCVETLY